MTERTSGLRSILGFPWVYELFQQAVGSPRVRQKVVAHLGVRPGDAVIDIGCGPGDIVDLLPDVRYVGFDPSPAYIASARERHGHRGEFFVAGIDDVDTAALDSFDVALAKSVLHHVDDAQAAKLFAFARSLLRPGGRLVTLDCCYSPHQSALARFVVSRDRGQNVRTVEGYRRLAQGSFDAVEAVEHHDLLRIPYSHVILECSNERAA